MSPIETGPVPSPATPPGPMVPVVGAALVDRLREPARLLAAHRRGHGPDSGWELPGGKVEAGESPVDALHRELMEELAVQVVLGDRVLPPGCVAPDADDLTAAGGWWPLGPRHIMATWLAEVTSGVPAALDDHDELRWLDPAELWSVGWLPGDAPIVAAIAGRLRQGPGR